MGKDEGPDMPTALVEPALRALAGAGYTRLEQLADLDPAELGRLHGLAPRHFDCSRKLLPPTGR
jgi:hypothetical protein